MRPLGCTRPIRPLKDTINGTFNLAAPGHTCGFRPFKDILPACSAGQFVSGRTGRSKIPDDAISDTKMTAGHLGHSKIDAHGMTTGLRGFRLGKPFKELKKPLRTQLAGSWS